MDQKKKLLMLVEDLFLRKIKRLNITNFRKNLYTKSIPDPEILIRTGGTPKTK